jgi:hypothetical protein
MNDLPVGCSVDEALHLVQVFQSTVGGLSLIYGADILTCRGDDEG